MVGAVWVDENGRGRWLGSIENREDEEEEDDDDDDVKGREERRSRLPMPLCFASFRFAQAGCGTMCVGQSTSLGIRAIAKAYQVALSH